MVYSAAMRVLTFDIETANWLGDPGVEDYKGLNIALVGTHDSLTGQYDSFLEADFPRLWKIMEEVDALVGFNSDHFDIPLLNKYYPGDLARIKSIDLMVEVQKVIGRRMRLDALAEGTLGKKKSGHGGQSIVWWRAGEVEKVRKYCLKDVELTRNLFDHALEHGSLKYKELGRTQEVKLDTSSWHTAASQPMTFTLGF